MTGDCGRRCRLHSHRVITTFLTNFFVVNFTDCDFRNKQTKCQHATLQCDVKLPNAQWLLYVPPGLTFDDDDNNHNNNNNNNTSNNRGDWDHFKVI